MNIINQFPFLKDNVYLDSAGGSLKPIQVVNRMSDFYLNYPISNHSINSSLGSKVQVAISETRELIRDLVDGHSVQEVVFTSGTTDSLNRISKMIQNQINEGDEILIHYLNHSSHIVPWVEVAKSTKAVVKYSDNILRDINSKTKIIAYTQQTNNLNIKQDQVKIWDKANKNNAFIINDAAQAISHEKVSLKYCHALAFSGNKLFGPTGIGALVINEVLIPKLKPVTFGGWANYSLVPYEWKFKKEPEKFEPGTLNTAGIIGLNEAIKFFKKLENIFEHENEVSKYCFDQLSKVKNIKIHSSRGASIILFNINPFHPQDIVSYLGYRNIFLRSGVFCAYLSHKLINAKSSVRISLSIYNTKKDIDRVVSELKNGGNFIEL